MCRLVNSLPSDTRETQGQLSKQSDRGVGQDATRRCVALQSAKLFGPIVLGCAQCGSKATNVTGIDLMVLLLRIPFVFIEFCAVFHQFLCVQNISLFVTTCKQNYGLRESDMFDPMMLYNLTDFHKVLIALSKLSQSVRVVQLHPNIWYKYFNQTCFACFVF